MTDATTEQPDQRPETFAQQARSPGGRPLRGRLQRDRRGINEPLGRHEEREVVGAVDERSSGCRRRRRGLRRPAIVREPVCWLAGTSALRGTRNRRSGSRASDAGVDELLDEHTSLCLERTSYRGAPPNTLNPADHTVITRLPRDGGLIASPKDGDGLLDTARVLSDRTPTRERADVRNAALSYLRGERSRYVCYARLKGRRPNLPKSRPRCRIARLRSPSVQCGCAGGVHRYGVTGWPVSSQMLPDQV